MKKKKKKENPPSLLLFGCLIVRQTHGTPPRLPPRPTPEELIYLPGVFVLRLLIITVGVYFDTLSAATTGPSTAFNNWRARREEKRLNGKKKKKRAERGGTLPLSSSPLRLILPRPPLPLPKDVSRHFQTDT